MLRVGEHRDLSPHAVAAEADLFVQRFGSVLHAAVFLRDRHEGRPDELRFGRVAIQAIALPHQRQAWVGRLRLAVTGHEGGGHEGAEAELERLVRGVAVLGVLHGHLESNLLAGREEVAVLRRSEAHLRRRIAHDNGHARAGAAAVGVLHGEFDREVTGRGQRRAHFRAFAESAVAGLQLPSVGQGFAFRVAGTSGAEFHRQRSLAGARRDGSLGDGRQVAADIGDLVEAAVVVRAPGLAVVHEVQATIGTEDRVHGPLEEGRALGQRWLELLDLIGGITRDDLAVGERFETDQVGVGVEACPFDERSLPIPEQQATVEVFREAVGLLERRGVMEDRAGAGRAAAFAELGPLLRILIGPVDEGRRGGREVGQSRIVRAGVTGVRGVGERPDRVRGEVDLGVGVVIADEVGPAEVAGLTGLVNLVIASWAAGAVGVRVRADFAPIDEARGAVDGEAPRVAAAHGEDFGARLGRADREEVAGGDLIGAVRLGADAVHLAGEAHGVAGGFLRVPRQTARALVGRRVALAVAERVRVVPGRPVEVAVRTKEHAAAVVTALLALLVVAEQHLLALQVEDVVLDGEARDGLAVEADRGIEAVDPAVLGELRVEREAQEAVLLLEEDRELADDLHLLGLEVDGFQQAAVFVEVEPTVRPDLRGHRLRDVAEQLLDLEARVFRRGGRRVCAGAGRQ